MKAWHFTDDRLRDYRPVPPVGETLHHKGKVHICHSGLHGSPVPYQALRYAPGTNLHRVEITGNLVHRHDKLAGQHRTILASMDVAKLLRQFAIQCVLDVIRLPALKHNRDLHKDLPIEYLTTGGIESKRIPAINALNSYMVPIPEEDHILVLAARAAMNIAMDVCPTYAAKRIVHYAGRARKFALPEEKTFEWQKMQRDKFNQMIHTAFEDLYPNEEGE